MKRRILGYVPLTNRELNVKNQELVLGLTKTRLIRGLVTMVVMGGIITVLAPFGMGHIALSTSLIFWVIICILGYLIYAPSIHLSHRFLSCRISHSWLRVAIAVLGAGTIMSLIIPALSAIFFENNTAYFPQVIIAFTQTSIIGTVITVICLMQQLIKEQQLQLVHSQMIIEAQSLDIQATHHQQLEELMNKLPLEKRGQLICLEMDDHYLKVYTDKGHHLILMRFKDARALLENVDGFQTHRSWWVSRNAIVAVERSARKRILVLTNHLRIPVSRTYEKQLFEKGLI